MCVPANTAADIIPTISGKDQSANQKLFCRFTSNTFACSSVVSMILLLFHTKDVVQVIKPIRHLKLEALDHFHIKSTEKSTENK